MWAPLLLLGTLSAPQDLPSRVGELLEARCAGCHVAGSEEPKAARKWDQALADYNQAIRFDPKSAKAHHNRGEVLREMKQLDKALADFNEAIRLDPKLVHAYRRRGQVWQAKGQLEKALGDYKQAVRPVLQR